MQFGRISIMLVCDFSQFQPVTDELLHHSIPSGNTSFMGYLEYRSVATLFKLAENQRLSYADQQKFRDFLIRLRNEDNTLED